MKILISQIADITWQKYYSRSISRSVFARWKEMDHRVRLS